MYIKSIVLDGFKSYGQRTEINGFDREFNAITGLNGTGKSNILDSICFVLGITNLNQVRAGSLQDLIYKNGQAGVHKATVSIIFDNSNAQQSPPGFEHYKEITITRQVIMGGKNKYMLNGSNIQHKRIQDLFCSIQLNVNNPHFLIMQGRITKVLNMKPAEILSMIEETAGTRMYEQKRQMAQKTIEKKDAKYRELHTIFTEEISPKLQKLREERALYIEFQTIEREVEHMIGLFQAWQYYATQKATVNAKQALEEGQAKITNIQNKIEKHQTAAEDIDREVEEVTRQTKSTDTEKLQEIEKELKAKEMEEAKANAAEKSSKENISTEEKKKKQLEKDLKDDENALKSKESELSKVQNLFQQLKENDAADSEAFAASQKRFEAVSAGMDVNEEGKAETLQEQLMGAKTAVAQARTEYQQASMQITYCQTQLKEKQKELASTSTDTATDQNNLTRMEKEVKALESQLGKLNYSEETMRDLQERKRSVIRENRGLKERIENFEAHKPYTQFGYRDPETNFDRRKVFGVICRLLKLKNRETAVALETAAGGRLYNVVVDTDVTSKKLLQRGNLQYRTTFIPLNKIQSGKISQQTEKMAKDLVGAENVHSALSLITYDGQLQRAMEYVFGNTFICKDLNVAKQVAFHDRILKRCVTLDGDVVEPAGTLSGGARQKGGSLLLQLEEILQCEETLRAAQNESEAIENQIRQMSSIQEKWMNIKNQLELKKHELTLIRKRLEQTPYHQLQAEIEELKSTIAELTEKMKTSKDVEQKNNLKAKELESKMKDSKGHRERQLKEAEAEMKRRKVKAEKSRDEWKKREQEYESLILEISVLKEEIGTIREQIATSEETLKNLKEQHQTLKSEADKIKEVVSKLQQEFKAEKNAIAERNREIQKKLHKKEQLLAQITEFELEIKKLDHEIKQLSDEYKNSTAREKEYSNKCKNKAFLEQAAALSDVEARSLENRIRNAQERRNKLSRRVNAKAQSMYDVEEKQYNTLLQRMKVIEKDKMKIELVIKDLEKKKKEVIMLAWEQVTKDFGSIFGTLLPGANAKLKPPDGKTVMDGLEVKVSLGGVWKESLSELSGGQRSLVALSLILAMLLFKPAPLYILDEVDAALDLSHTQNIGNMLKSHFRQSQFIIVSLKDGMFNNANVLFKTKFVDGMSAVTRTVNKSQKGG